ncbi:BppU family phage baseplate upper protein, partial [uncultured Clostridium sp.]|uniref:BppU family phage baseplate upper protein n=1 Tax=uncultured Clostridium sp. TaxID=59620 RepID=UPI0028EB8938
MELKEFDIILDIKRAQRNEYIEVVQGDTDTNIFNIALKKDFEPYPLTGTTVEISFAKSDGTTVVQDKSLGITITDATNGKIKCELKTNTIAAPGRVRAEVRVLEGSKILTSTSFEFFVKRAIFGDDTIKSSNEWPLLSKLLDASNNESTRIANENTRISNENTRKSNENSRITEEGKRV